MLLPLWMNGFNSVGWVFSWTDVAPAGAGAASDAIWVPPMLIVAPDTKEMSPAPSVASIFAAFSVMLEILLTSPARGPVSWLELMLWLKLGAPPAWKGWTTSKSFEARPQPARARKT